MNMIICGIGEEAVRAVAERCACRVCSDFGRLAEGNNLVLQPHPASDAERLELFERMSANADRIDAVIVASGEHFSAVHYSSEPGKFFTVDASDDGAEYELQRIVETQLGLLCAHEGI